MASGNSSNANRYKGEDIDGDGDGSVDDADTLQGNQPSDIQSSIDNETIVENNGTREVNLGYNLQVFSGSIASLPYTNKLISFESGYGSWNTNGRKHLTASGISADGSQSARMIAYDSNEFVEIAKTLDLTNFTTLIFYYGEALIDADNYPLESSDEFYVKVGGNYEIQRGGSGQQTGFNKIEVDVSSYSGNQTVKIGYDNQSGQRGELFLDDIKLQIRDTS